MFESHRISRGVLSIVLALMTLGTDALFTQGRSPARDRRMVILDGREVVEGEVIVRYRGLTGQIERERAEFQADSEASEAIGRRGFRRMSSRHLTTREMLARLRANPDVEHVEPNYIIRASAVPNDTSMGQLWGLLNTGQTVDGNAGVPGADIGAAAAWDLTTGSRVYGVAILDTGIDVAHPDLAANVFSAPSQFSVTIGSTTVTCAAGTHGFNALTNTCIPNDDNGHGTHVAGIIGAVGNNNLGVTGVNWIANLMAIKVLGADGNGTTSDAIKGIDFVIKAKAALGAAANVRVLNASWGGANFSQAFNDEIVAANSADMLFVASAGSNSSNNDSVPHYPASSTSSNVLSVAAVDNRGVLASFSNYGANSVHLAAPGASTLSTLAGNHYGYLSGTSMAAPHVAGAAALVLSACPSLNTASLKSALLSSVDPDASLSGKTQSGGRLNVNAAVRTCVPGNATLTVNMTTVAPGAPIEAVITNDLPRERDWVGLYSVGAADSAFLGWTYLNGTKTPPSAPIGNATISIPAPATPGTYQLRLFTNGYNKLATSSDVTVGTQPSVSISDAAVTEGNSGTTTATFTVTLSRTSSQTVSVNYATANGTAIAGTDYISTSGNLNFPPSTMTRQFSVTVNGDTTTEPTETFVVNLSNPINATIADGQAVGTITTDDGSPTPTLTLAATTVAPGGAIDVTVANGPGVTNDWIGRYVPTAVDTAFQDWVYLNGQKTLPATGQSNVTVRLTAPTAPGTYQLRLFTNGYNKLATSATFTVGSLPTLSINDVTITEGNSGTAIATFTVGLSAASAQTVTVAYATANGSATAGSDFTAVSGTLTFAPSTLTQTFSVTISGDTTVEPTETFTINLTNATNAGISDGSGLGTITNDDGSTTPTLTLAATTVAPGGAIDVTVANGPGVTNDWIGRYVPTAADGAFQDWVYLNGQKTLPATGQSNVTVRLTAPTAPGDYQLRLFTNGYNRLATSATFTVGSLPTLSINDVTITEGNSGTAIATFTVGLSAASGQTVTVAYTTANGSATAGSDFTAVSGTLTFAPSTLTQTFGVTISGDTTVEPTETFTINLSNATNAGISDGSGLGTITNDDGSTTPTLTLAATTVAPGGAIDVTVANGPGRTNDWIGLYVPTAADGAFLDWVYLNGQKTLPATGQSNVTVRVTAPTTPGTYQLRLFTNGYNKLATATITVGSAPSSSTPSLTVNTPNVSRGGMIEIVVSNGPGVARDWLGIYTPSSADASFQDWVYLNGQKTLPASGLSNVTVQFPAPSVAGTYEVRLFTNGYNKLATSTSITVSP